MALPMISEQELRTARTIRCALFRIYGCDHTNIQWRNAHQDFASLDGSIGVLFDFDCKYQMIEMLAPLGDLQSTRKVWSYSGGVRKNRGIPLSMTNNDPSAVRDPGNYYYGVVMRCIAQFFPESHWRCYVYAVEYGDAKLGDILEAVLGVAWLGRHGYLNMDVETLSILNQYTQLIEQCVIDVEKVISRTIAMGIWTDSRSLAMLLL